ncbi:hypothetical protein BC835DRAFT_838133 [Cytidiella melzeri]|nr:hypothetical protein BC835DRAFT_838133 [Cytidiella melzeri]
MGMKFTILLCWQMFTSQTMHTDKHLSIIIVFHRQRTNTQLPQSRSKCNGEGWRQRDSCRSMPAASSGAAANSSSALVTRTPDDDHSALFRRQCVYLVNRKHKPGACRHNTVNSQSLQRSRSDYHCGRNGLFRLGISIPVNDAIRAADSHIYKVL